MLVASPLPHHLFHGWSTWSDNRFLFRTPGMNPCGGGAQERGTGGLDGSRARSAVVVAVGDELPQWAGDGDTNSAWLGGSPGRGGGLPVVRGTPLGGRSLPRGLPDAVSGDWPGANWSWSPAAWAPPTTIRHPGRPGASILHRPLRLDEALVESLADRFLQRGFKALPAANLRQARVPEGATIPSPIDGVRPRVSNWIFRPGGVGPPPRRPRRDATLVTEQVLPSAPRSSSGRGSAPSLPLPSSPAESQSSLAGLVEPLLASRTSPPWSGLPPGARGWG